MTDTTPYTVPKERGRWRGLILAVLVHGALVLMLWVGVSWQSETPGTIEAEIWNPTAQMAAPRPPPPPPPLPEEKKVEPPPPPVVKEQPRPEPPPPPPKPEVKPQPQPDIALEQEKKRKEEEARKRAEEERLAEQRRRQEQERLAQEKKKREEEERLAQEKKKREEEQRLALEKKRQEEERKRREEQRLAQEKAAREKAAAEEKARQEREAQELAALEKAREQELSRLKGSVAGTGGSGEAARSQGTTDAGYAGRIRGLIISNTEFLAPPTLAGNPAVEYAVELLPDGRLRNAPRKLRSGVPGFDEAVLLAIELSQPFPRDRNGSVPSSITIVHRPKKDQ